MTPQERAILDAFKDKVFDAEVPFLTNADVPDTVNLAIAGMGGCFPTDQSLTEKRFQTWLDRKVYEPWVPNPDLRNRLYCAVDIVVIAALQHLAESGIQREVASQIAKAIGKAFERGFATPEGEQYRPIFVDFRRVGDSGEESRTLGVHITMPKFKGEPETCEAFKARTKSPIVWAIDWRPYGKYGIDAAQVIWREKAAKLSAKLKGTVQ